MPDREKLKQQADIVSKQLEEHPDLPLEKRQALEKLVADLNFQLQMEPGAQSPSIADDFNKAAIEFETLPDDVRNAITSRASGYASPVDFYVEKLKEGIATLGAAFFPKPVIVRLSDFKSNEYSSLVGGQLYEPNEENPMLGFRGELAHSKDFLKVNSVLDVSGVMPSKIFLPDDLRYHRSDPALVLQRFESYILRSLNSWISCIVTLQGITASAHAARNQSKLRARFAFPRWQAVT